MVLKEWSELPYNIRRSRKKLYEYIRTNISEEEPDEPVAETSTVTANVTDGSSGIASITVTLTDTTDSTKTYTANTITGGTASITEVPYGTYAVTATGEGYEAYTSESNLTVDGATETVNITMTATPTTTDIAVSVTDGTDPVGNIDVVLTDTTDNTKTYTAKSGNAGGCTLSNVAFGTYAVTATGEGYENYTGAENLTVTAETTSLSITVTASTPDPEEQEEVPGGE